MKCLISEDTTEALNILLKETFQMNAFSDNLAYSLDTDFNCVKATKIYHEKFAHAFPSFADEISEFMSSFNVRAVRIGLTDECKVYSDIYNLFYDNFIRFGLYRESIIEVINTAKSNNDLEVSIFLEGFLIDKLKFLKQSSIWCQKAKEYMSLESFDKDFNDFDIL